MTETDTTIQTTTTAPAAPAPDAAAQLTALQAHLDQATAQAATEQATALGFDTPDQLAEFITAQREAIEQAKSDEQKRADTLAAAEKAAAEREAEANQLIRQTTVHLALIRAGVAPDNVTVAAPLVTLTGDVTAETADAAVAELAKNPALASLFAPPAPTGAKSTLTGQPGGETGGAQLQTGLDRGKALYEQYKATRRRTPQFTK